MFNLIHCLLLRLSCSDDSEYLLSDLGSRCSREFGCLIVVGAAIMRSHTLAFHLYWWEISFDVGDGDLWPLSTQACQRICQWHPSFGTLASETCPWWSCEQLRLWFAASTIRRIQTGFLPAPSCFHFATCLTLAVIFMSSSQRTSNIVDVVWIMLSCYKCPNLRNFAEFWK